MNKGYSLPQLLVVIAVIGILSSIMLFMAQEHRKSARDGKRLDDLKKITQALELYHDDHGTYPPTLCSNTNTFGWDCQGWIRSYMPAQWSNFNNNLKSYLGVDLPMDPVNSSCEAFNDNCYSYVYGNVYRNSYAHQYDLTGQLENKKSPLRCEVKQYRWGPNGATAWCGSWSKYLFEASD